MTECNNCHYKGTLICEVDMPCIDWVEIDELVGEYEMEQKGETE